VAVILFDYPTSKFTVWDYFENIKEEKGNSISFVGRVYNPTFSRPSSDSIRFSLNFPAQSCRISVSPQNAKILTEKIVVTIEGCADKDGDLTYLFGFYVNNTELKDDYKDYTINNLLLVKDFDEHNFIKTYIPMADSLWIFICV
jgi:hypothetical protein